MKRLLVALVALFAAGQAHAVCVPSNATPGMMGCEPIATSMAGTDYIQIWIPGSFPNSANLITLNNVLAVPLAIKASSLIVTGPATISPINANVDISPSGTGVLTLSSGTLGSINNLTIGLTTPAAGKFTTLQATSTVTLSPASANVAISPTGTGTVTINSGTAGAIDNVTLGFTTPLSVKSTTLTATGAVALSPVGANVVISPTTTGLVTISPNTAGSMNNMVIGGSTPLAITSTTLTATGAVALSPANLNVVISPTGSGLVTLNPATLGSINNMSIGATTASTGKFTTLTVNSQAIVFNAAGTFYPGHSLINVQTFCASGCTSGTGTYTATAGTNQVVFEVVSAGGGSGGCGATGAASSCAGGSAASGSYAKVLYTTAFSGITITVGAAGTAGTSGPTLGGVGGTTSVGTLISCPGGTGGPVGVTANLTVYTVLTGGAVAPSACTITGGTTLASVQGQSAGFGFGYVNTIGGQVPGAAGSTPLGFGVVAYVVAAATSPGLAGFGYGWGAYGSVNDASQSATAGLAGGPSRVIIYEFN